MCNKRGFGRNWVRENAGLTGLTNQFNQFNEILI